MANLALAAMFFALALAFSATGYLFRGWQDGTLVSRSEADLIAQGRVDEAVKWTKKIDEAEDAKQAAIARVNAPPIVVSHACPPGTGAVSADALQRMRDAANRQD